VAKRTSGNNVQLISDLMRGFMVMKCERFLHKRYEQSASVKFLSSIYRFTICFACLLVFITPVHSENMKKIHGELSLLCSAAGSDGICCECIKKDIGSVRGVTIVSIESIPERIIEIDIDRNRRRMFGVEISMILSAFESIQSIKIISHDADSIIVEGMNEASINEIAHCRIKSIVGEPVGVLDIAAVRIINTKTRRPYAVGDRRVFMIIEIESDAYDSFNKLLQNKYLIKPDISWKLLSESEK
jgi:hypothetical protein